MGDNKISATVVRLACDAYDKVAQWGDVTNESEAMNSALESALPHLQGEAVPVAWMVRVPGKPFLDKIVRREDVASEHAESIHANHGESPEIIPLYTHPQPAELSEVSGGAFHASEWMQRQRMNDALDTIRNAAIAMDETVGGSGDPVLDAADILSAALAATGKQQDGCTESNCRRCLTHPDHRGDMPHAGIGSTGKQQVGEVQRDALVDTARRNIRQFISKASFSSSVDKQAALSCVDVLEAALASRQPVGQEPVRTVNADEAPFGLTTDLGQFRPMVQMYIEANERIEHLSDVAAWAVGQGKRLLALIDGRDAGAGVGRG